MILRNKILLGGLVVIGSVAIIVPLSLPHSKSKTKELDYSSKFISAVNVINNSLAFQLKDEDEARNGKKITSFQSPAIGVNNKFKTLFVDLKSFSKLAENDTEKNKLKNIALSLNLVHYVQKYIPISDSAFKRLNFNISLPKEYIDQEKKKNRTISEIIGIDHSKLVEDNQSEAAKYEIDGNDEFSIPKVDSEGKFMKIYKLNYDYSNPFFTNPITGETKPLKDVELSEIKESIIYQLTKAMYLADKTSLTTRFLNISNKDFIGDKLIADFSYLNNNKNKGIFTSIHKSNIKLLKAILRQEKFKTMGFNVKVIHSVEELNKLNEEENNHYHEYDEKGIPKGITPELINFHSKADKSNDIGIVATPSLQEKTNPLITEPDVIEKLTKQIAKEDSEIRKSMDAHKDDQKLYYQDRAKYGIKNKLTSWTDLSFKPPKNLSEIESEKFLTKYFGFKKYSDFGYSPSIELFQKIHSDSSSETKIGNIINFNNSSSLGEIIDFAFNENNVQPEGLLSKIKSLSPNDDDHDGLFETNSKEVNYQKNPHSLLSIKHPLILSTNDDRFTFLNFMKNYRTSIKSQSRVVFTKEDFKRNIFKDPQNASDEDLLTFIMLLAKMFDSNNIQTLNNDSPMQIPVSGVFAINLGVNEEKIRTILSQNNVDISQLIFESGHIILSKNKITSNMAETILKILFKLDEFTYSDLNKVEDKTPSKNNLKFDDKTIDDASKKAEEILNSDNFKKMLIKQSKVAISNQTFATPSESLEKQLENDYKKMFPNNKAELFNQSKIGKGAIKTLPKYADDILFSRLDNRGNIFNVRNDKKTFLSKNSAGFSFKREITSDLRIGFEKILKGNSKIYTPLKYDNSSLVKWIEGTTDDDRLISLSLYLYLLDKLNLKVQWSVWARNDSNLSKEENKKQIDATIKELKDIFGENNIYGNTIEEKYSGSKIILELKTGHYLDAMKNYFKYAFSSGIATNHISEIDRKIELFNKK
ncbi:MAG: hypothetical protein HRT99_03320 [Mycoplasmatales bacterium]|nr:hypothetical protein [Mycoplasmatales bacterium]